MGIQSNIFQFHLNCKHTQICLQQDVMKNHITIHSHFTHTNEHLFNTERPAHLIHVISTESLSQDLTQCPLDSAERLHIIQKHKMKPRQSFHSAVSLPFPALTT